MSEPQGPPRKSSLPAPSAEEVEVGRHVARRAQPMPEPAPIVPIGDPATLLRSLGDPPLPGQGAVAEHHLKAVVERAAQVAIALAAAADLLVEPGDEVDLVDG